ncbi:MAG: esterase-like activity of phytase family protein [Pirellulales bacterium]|nr:esterase-like activity of phytase family protein [Pirellulales bacterium]
MKNLKSYRTRFSTWFSFMLFTHILVSSLASAASWSLNPLNDVLLDTTSVGFSVSEMSGVTYLGTSPILGKHRFAVVQDASQDVVLLDASFTLTGSLLSAEAVDRVTLDALFDFEGIADAGDGIFVSEENGPGVREYDFSTGSQLQSVSIPSVFTAQKRPNKGFESLARNSAGTKMWTANEEALLVDGPTASPTQSTLVRILEFDVNGSSLTSSGQFAYEVDPVHDSGFSNARGLSELVSLPDGTLIALERSLAALTTTSLQASVYEIDFSAATDVSQAPFDQGLDGEEIIKVGKEELWAGEVGATGGENLEGLALGPRLPNGNWLLLGVVDSGDPISSNTIVSFELAPLSLIANDPDTGDFDQDGNTDGQDFLTWQLGCNVSSLPGLGHGDGTHDGAVDGDDLAVWESTFGVGASTPDFNGDSDIDGTDVLIWQNGFNSGTTLAERDANNSIYVDGADLTFWQDAHGQPVLVAAGASLSVPEPTTWGLLILAHLLHPLLIRQQRIDACTE